MMSPGGGCDQVFVIAAHGSDHSRVDPGVLQSVVAGRFIVVH
jgi:hypothetical protein